MSGSSQGSFLLDTNLVVAYFNREQAVRQRLSGITVFLPSIALGELYYGAYKSTRTTDNLKQIHDLIAILAVLTCDQVTADNYGQIKHALQVKGRPIPENDIWIAALAQQHHLILVTRDEHFKNVDGLPLEMW